MITCKFSTKGKMDDRRVDDVFRLMTQSNYLNAYSNQQLAISSRSHYERSQRPSYWQQLLRQMGYPSDDTSNVEVLRLLYQLAEMSYGTGLRDVQSLHYTIARLRRVYAPQQLVLVESQTMITMNIPGVIDATSVNLLNERRIVVALTPTTLYVVNIVDGIVVVERHHPIIGHPRKIGGATLEPQAVIVAIVTENNNTQRYVFHDNGTITGPFTNGGYLIVTFLVVTPAGARLVKLAQQGNIIKANFNNTTYVTTLRDVRKIIHRPRDLQHQGLLYVLHHDGSLTIINTQTFYEQPTADYQPVFYSMPILDIELSHHRGEDELASIIVIWEDGTCNQTGHRDIIKAIDYENIIVEIDVYNHIIIPPTSSPLTMLAQQPVYNIFGDRHHLLIAL